MTGDMRKEAVTRAAANTMKVRAPLGNWDVIRLLDVVRLMDVIRLFDVIRLLDVISHMAVYK